MADVARSEGVILAGGLSRRMGVDKAGILIDGQPSLARIVASFKHLDWPVTLLGGKLYPGAAYQADLEPHLGPLATLRGFRPSGKAVFVASCDLLLFDDSVPYAFVQALENFQAVVPRIEGFLQPLCGLYSSGAFEVLRELPDLKRVHDWTSRLNCRVLEEENLMSLGVDPWKVRGANTPEEARELIERKSARWRQS